MVPGRFDTESPGIQAELEAADVLAEEAGMSLIHLARAFVAQHPAVTSPIVGARTVEPRDSQLGAADVTLTTDVLNRIDEIVPPRVTVARDDEGYVPPALSDPFLRRRRTS